MVSSLYPLLYAIPWPCWLFTFPCCSVTKSCLTLCDPVDCSMPDFPVLHCLPEFAQTHVHWVSDAIQPYHSLLSPSPPALNLSQHQGLFQWIGSSHQMAYVLELQLQYQFFQWIFRLISFRIDWFDLLAVQGTLRSLIQHHNLKASILRCLAFFKFFALNLSVFLSITHVFYKQQIFFEKQADNPFFFP